MGLSSYDRSFKMAKAGCTKPPVISSMQRSIRSSMKIARLTRLTTSRVIAISLFIYPRNESHLWMQARKAVVPAIIKALIWVVPQTALLIFRHSRKPLPIRWRTRQRTLSTRVSGPTRSPKYSFLRHAFLFYHNTPWDLHLSFLGLNTLQLWM